MFRQARTLTSSTLASATLRTQINTTIRTLCTLQRFTSPLYSSISNTNSLPSHRSSPLLFSPSFRPISSSSSSSSSTTPSHSHSPSHSSNDHSTHPKAVDHHASSSSSSSSSAAAAAADHHDGGDHDASDDHHSHGDFLDKAEVEERVLSVLRNIPKVNTNVLTNSSTFASLGLDSLDQVEVVIQLEEEFVIDLYDPVASEIVSVPQAVEIISNFPFAK